MKITATFTTLLILLATGLSCSTDTNCFLEVEKRWWKTTLPSVGLPINFTVFSGSHGLFLGEIDWEHIRSYKIKEERIVFQDKDILIGMDGCTYSDYSDRKNNMAQTNRVHKFSYIMRRPLDLIGSEIKSIRLIRAGKNIILSGAEFKNIRVLADDKYTKRLKQYRSFKELERSWVSSTKRPFQIYFGDTGIYYDLGFKFKDTNNSHIIPFVSIRREKNIYHVFQGEWKGLSLQLLAEDKMKIIHFDVLADSKKLKSPVGEILTRAKTFD